MVFNVPGIAREFEGSCPSIDVIAMNVGNGL